MTPAPPLHLEVAEGFGAVADAFRENFAARGELGAACAVYRAGEKVVDLRGGWRDHRVQAPWEEDTLVLVFSATKGLAALPLALLHSRGRLDYDLPVAHYWPEFAQAGKQAVTVRQLLSHQAGLAALDQVLTLEDLADLDRMAEILARQRPAWEPGTRQGYHGLTLGWYEGELVRRVDPAGRSLGRFFREEVAEPMGAEFYIGTPADLDEGRVAHLVDYHPARLLLHLGELPWRFAVAVLNPFSLAYRTLRNPRLSRPAQLSAPAYRRVEIPAGNGVGRVESMARIYGDLATGGRRLGLRPATLAALRDPAPRPSGGSYDLVLHLNSLYSLGFAKPAVRENWLASPDSFGAFGAGGSFAFADPEVGVGYAYAMTRLGFKVWDDPRERALRAALYRCLQG